MNKFLLFFGVALFLAGTLVTFSFEIVQPWDVAPDTATVQYGQTKTFTAQLNGVEPQQSVVYVSWFVNGYLKLADSGDYTNTFTYTTEVLGYGTHYVKAEVLGDEGGLFYSDTSTLTVQSLPVPTPTPSPPPSPPPPIPGSINVQISATNGGYTNPVAGVHSYTIGSTVTVTATATGNYKFDFWQFSNGATSKTNPFTTTATESFSIQAVFAAPAPTPAPTPVPTAPPNPNPNPDPLEVNVQISTSEGGTTIPAPGLYEYTEGESVVIETEAYEGFVFDYWLRSDGWKGYDATYTGTASTDFSVMAVFKPIGSGDSGSSDSSVLLGASLQLGGILAALTGVILKPKNKGKT